MKIHSTFNIQHLTYDTRRHFVAFSLSLFIVICYLLNVKSLTFAATRFPIRNLGNCQSAQECYLYCQIPANTPACWAYANKDSQVLGDSDVQISYPISELGDCNNAKECFSFCNQDANKQTCLTYGQNHGLTKSTKKIINSRTLEFARSELGCNSKDDCRDFCSESDNFDKCRAFGEKYGLAPKLSVTPAPPDDFLKTARSDLGCTNTASCINYCEKPDNRDKCLDFAAKTGKVKKSAVLRDKIIALKSTEILAEAKSVLGCETFSSCAALCSIAENKDRCHFLEVKFKLNSDNLDSDENQDINDDNESSAPGQFKKYNPLILNLKACTKSKECITYCQSHPGECPGFESYPNSAPKPTGNSSNVKPGSSVGKMSEFNSGNNTGAGSNNIIPGSFLGPGGCKTNKECSDYCIQHPDTCGGFSYPYGSKTSPARYPSPAKKPETTTTPIPTQSYYTGSEKSTSIPGSGNNISNIQLTPTLPGFEMP